MAVNENLGYFFCFRNPKHKGQNITVLLRKLHIPAHEYKGLRLEEESQSITEDTRDYGEWNYFEPADENEEALSYLEARLFLNPLEIARRFNLRVSKQGHWCGRLLIPLTIGWTGRAMREHLTLRYDAYTSEEGFYLFKQHSSSCVLQEGALDCIRIASVSTQFDVVGKCRMALSPAILAYLREANYDTIYHAPDATVPYSIAHAEKLLVKSYCVNSDVVSLVPPTGKKDFCAGTESAVRQVLSTLGAERVRA